MTRALRVPVLWLLPGMALAGVAVSSAAEGADAARLLQAALNALGVLLVWAVACLAHARPSSRRLGVLLFMLAAAHTLQSLAASTNPLLHTVARAGRPVVEVLLAWVLLAFPGGRLQTRFERAVLAVACLAVLALWLPGLMLSPRIPMAGAHVICAGPCPENRLMVADRPDLAEPLLLAFKWVGAGAYAMAVVLLAARLRGSRPAVRRLFFPVVLAGVARALNVAAFLATGSLALGLVFTFWAIPAAVALGLLDGQARVTNALLGLVRELRERPDASRLRDLLANALGDQHLGLVYRLAGPSHWVDAKGRPVDLAEARDAGQRAVTTVTGSDGQPVAALLHDRRLLDDAELLQAVAASAVVVLESHRVEAELLDSRAHAVAHERDRIERDLHDGAQQRLIALRMKLGVTGRLIRTDPGQAAELLRELDRDVIAAIAELRELARGARPTLLERHGLTAALAEAARRLTAAGDVDLPEVGRLDAEVEGAVYFCCLEALQNAAKHAGNRARVGLGLRAMPDALEFWVTDDGVGFAQSATRAGGRGLANMHARLEAVAGNLTIGTAPGGGVSVRGSVPRRAARGPGHPAPEPTATHLPHSTERTSS